MTTITANDIATRPPFRLTRRRVMALVMLALGAFIFISASQSYSYDVVTILTLARGAVETVPHLTIPTLTFLQVTAVFFLVTGVLGWLDREAWARFVNGLMIVSAVLVAPTIVIAATAGNSTNITTLIAESFRLATPIAIGAMAGIWCERSGVINIAIEGMMLLGACFGFATLFLLLPYVPDEQLNLLLFGAVIVGVLAGGLAALLHAWLSITFATDQIVSGTVINILAVGVTSFVRAEYFQSSEAGFNTLPTVTIPVLSDMPILGEAFFQNKPIFFMMFVVVIGTHIVLFYTRWGLRMRAVGEAPSAADTLGVKVNRMRWINVFIGGLIAGLAGAWFSLEATGRFSDGMTNGTGFISLAAMIFGKWTPFGAFAGALLFGFADALGTRFQLLAVPVPVQFLQMVPYIVTLIVLAGFVGRAIPPKAIGQPYKKE